MDNTIEIHFFNNVYIRINCSEAIARELNSYFTLEIPGAKYSPQAKRGHWDGKIKLFNLQRRTIYAGLLENIQQFAALRKYKVELIGDNFKHQMFTYNDALEFINSLGIPDKFQRREFQIEALQHAVSGKRNLFLSPTGSGKSMIIYTIFRYFNQKTLLIVPTANLLLQMQGDFKDYGYTKQVGQFGDGVHEDDADVVVSTWQSAIKQPKDWFNQFGLVICDEAHLAKAKSIKTIMESLPNCKYRFGLTGTLDGSKTNALTLQGLFGPVKKLATTVNLIEEGVLSPFSIKAIKLVHPDWARKYVKKYAASYQDEMTHLIRLRKRNNFIRNLALRLTGNTLVLFHRVEDHGKHLFQSIKDKSPDRQVFYIHGGVKAEERDRIRYVTERSDNVIIVASYGTLSLGVNIRKLDNLIFASPWKSQIINLQSIGRVLRPSPGKEATLYDIGDDLQWKSRLNHTLNHMVSRIKIYASEEFSYKIYDVPLNYSMEDTITL